MSTALFDLSGKTALITGSSKGLGYAIAKGIAEAGATVILNGRNVEQLEKAVGEFNAAGLTAHGKAFDVIQRDQVETAVAEIEEEIGPIDILINNAGIQDRAPLEEMTDEQWQKVIDINLSSVFIVSQVVGRNMLTRKRGKIITTCSLMTEIQRPTISNYAAAKGGLKTFIRAMTVEWAKHNIQINGIGPGYFRTDLTQKLYDDETFNGWITGRTPAGRWGEPEELVGAAIFLASEASNYVNGQIIYVDGGILAAV
ncbi:MAG: SDR family NAD(P)-dependent oxidoreductase [Planctomycetota bacterium]|jgi:gluconate 5-dehydrogenase